jgi:hypothetical protein
VGDRLGWNEKTKVVAKLQRSGAGPPAREPAVSEEERKAMMAHYFKRQVNRLGVENLENNALWRFSICPERTTKVEENEI